MPALPNVEWYRLLPPVDDLSVFRTSAINKKLKEAKSAMKDMNSYLQSMEYGREFLMVLLSLYEAHSSSEIEDIIIGIDDLFKSCLDPSGDWDDDVIFVRNNYNALRIAYDKVRSSNLIRYSDIIKSHSALIGRPSDIRSKPGTVIASGNFVVHNPPQSRDKILELMKDLLWHANVSTALDLPAYVKLAIYHGQFESIHPFYEGNGRMGRVFNMMYLTKTKSIKYPIFYLSRYFSDYRSEYYMLLNQISRGIEWENWTLFMLNALISAADLTKTIAQDVLKLWGNRGKYFNNLGNELAQHVFYTGKILS